MKVWLKSVGFGALVGFVIGILHATGILDIMNVVMPSRHGHVRHVFAWNYSSDERLSHLWSYPLWWALGGAVLFGIGSLRRKKKAADDDSKSRSVEVLREKA